MTVNARVLAIAQEWVGTPYRHQASCRGVGTDCLGLLRGIWRELYGAEPEVVPAYSMDWSETGRKEMLLDACARHLRVASGPARPGDVLVMRMRDGAVAKHLAIRGMDRADCPTIIHAYSGHGVCVSPLADSWAARIVATYSFPEGGA